MKLEFSSTMLAALLSLRVTPPKCPTREIAFRVTPEDIARVEQAEAEGHQPGRSNPKVEVVADVALMQVEKGLNPARSGQPTSR